MKKRGKGIVICIASRAGTLDLPGGLSYAVSKTAVIRLVCSSQLELDIEGLGDDIQLYALHPGGVLTDMPKTPWPKDVQEAYPERWKAMQDWLPKFGTSRFLCASTCLYIASGKAKALKGRYFDCEQDIETVCKNASEIQEKDLYRLKVDFLGGLPNDGGIAKDLEM
jgi:NAD(P)-dependent dehydrogenase (short-subunit alcohol dehydrogenase family)